MGVPQNVSLATQSDVESQLKKDLNALTDEEQMQYFNWLTGKELDPPPVVRNMTINLAHKINVTTGYLTAINLTRMNKIQEFLSQAEEIIFQPERLASLPVEEVVKLYKAGQSILSTTLENSRRFIYQTKDLNDDSEVDEVYKMLQSLPPNVIRRIRTVIEAEGKGGSQIDES